MRDVPGECSRRRAPQWQLGLPSLASSQAWDSFYFQASGKPLFFRAVNLPPVSNTVGEIWQHQ